MSVENAHRTRQRRLSSTTCLSSRGANCWCGCCLVLESQCLEVRELLRSAAVYWQYVYHVRHLYRPLANDNPSKSSHPCCNATGSFPGVILQVASLAIEYLRGHWYLWWFQTIPFTLYLAEDTIDVPSSLEHERHRSGSMQMTCFDHSIATAYCLLLSF